jgi:hypothetical protein
MPMRNNSFWVVGGVALLGVCLCGCLAVVAFQRVGVSLPLGYVISACAGYAPQPFQVGVIWVAPPLSSLPRGIFFWPHRVCAQLPWLPFLPLSGSVVFPP